jgi:hypothetical protein
MAPGFPGRNLAMPQLCRDLAAHPRRPVGRPTVKLRTLAASVLAIAGLCACVPVRMGSATLAVRESPVQAARPFDLIDSQLKTSLIYSGCETGPATLGPVASLDATLIPSDEYVQEGRRAQALIEPYRFTIRLSNGPHRGETVQVTVPSGFVSDFHSTPDGAVAATLSIRRALEAAVVHDWLYAVGRHGDEAQREMVDQVYSDILAFYGVDGGTNWTVSTAVRWNGARNFGAAEELRFYNRCFYGWCSGEAAALRQSPVVSLSDDPGLRQRLWDLTVCIRRPETP